jgi:tRNA wybutosine-synthesizing protein 4
VVQQFMEAGEEGVPSAMENHVAAANAAAAAAPVPAVAALPFRSPFFAPTRTAAPPAFTPLPTGRPPSLSFSTGATVAASDAASDRPAAPSPPPLGKQIIALGAGSDTTYFKLKEAGVRLAPALYVEVDFAAPLAKKAAIIRCTPALAELVARRNESFTDDAVYEAAKTVQERRFGGAATAASASVSGGSTAAADDEHDPPGLQLPGAHDYALVGADLRDIPSLARSLARAGVDFRRPTLVLAECVLVYLAPEHSKAVLSFLSSAARAGGGGLMIASYEQLHPSTPFGQTMLSNLSARGCPLLGLPAYPDLASQRRRYLTETGFDDHEGWDMSDIYRFFLSPAAERLRIEQLEPLDELEEWEQLQAHYHISMACVDDKITREEHVAAAATELQQSQRQQLQSQPQPAKPGRIPWRQLGLLNPLLQQRRAHPPPSSLSAAAAVSSSQPPQQGGGTIVTASGRVIQLGVAAPRQVTAMAAPKHAPATAAAPAAAAAPATIDATAAARQSVAAPTASSSASGSLRKPVP